MFYVLPLGASAIANTTPVVSHVTAAAQVSTRSPGVPLLSVAPMSVSVSVHEECFMFSFKQTLTALLPLLLTVWVMSPDCGQNRPLCWLSPFVDPLKWNCAEPWSRVPYGMWNGPGCERASSGRLFSGQPAAWLAIQAGNKRDSPVPAYQRATQSASRLCVSWNLNALDCCLREIARPCSTL